MRENQKRSRNNLRIREVTVRGTVLRSTSYDEKEKTELIRKRAVSSSFNGRRVQAARVLAMRLRGSICTTTRCLLCRQFNGGDRITTASARDSKLWAERETGQLPIASGTMKRLWGPCGRDNSRPGTTVSGEPEPWRNFRGGEASRVTAGHTLDVRGKADSASMASAFVPRKSHGGRVRESKLHVSLKAATLCARLTGPRGANGQAASP
jgi:hypothetical protein